MGYFVIALGGAISLIVVSIIFSIPTMLLWDWLMPILFGLKEITLLQAWGLSMLCGILFQTHIKIRSNS